LEERFSTLVDGAKRRSIGKMGGDLPRIFIGMATCGIAAGAVENQGGMGGSACRTPHPGPNHPGWPVWDIVMQSRWWLLKNPVFPPLLSQCHAG